ncbi:3-oxoacyl-[acyl-carrier-protein] reductase [Liquorilactobacillus vini]|uniref:3-oxoacyl-[acyl-carrier-protein] reductase n=1 Tax=Liquorilactobacillus vini DSM 20605 TaxID=1133569 RepID=A0A0R2CAX1_9LACO|nr:3-oxoacyl-[acyl-carrier-protein] reductase [Liquorilactobacillus vini]KRM88888.1 3-oxoacyl-[acyl-carrier-protein] reductase [Liquorilactobacillus vini DSM 20605]
MKLTGKTVFITGSSRGIGAQIALAFARHGSNLILNARHEIPEDLTEQIKKLGVKYQIILGDIANPADVASILTEIYQSNRQLDILINNAGITKDKLIIGMSTEDFEQVLKTNLIGAFDLTRQVLKKMYRQKSGVIINLASVVGLHGNLGQANYAASKAGLIGLTKTIAKEGALRNIRCNALAPGMIKSSMTEVLSEKVQQKMLKEIPLGRFGQPAEVADAALFLAENDYITGEVLTIDGGMTI